MSENPKIALIQLCASGEVAYNIARATALIEKASGQGANLIMTPEMTGIFEQDKNRLLANTYTEAKDPALLAFKNLARDLKVWLLIGSLAIKTGKTKLANRCFLISPKGVEAKYDKIHMFDVKLPNGEAYRESATYTPGKKAVVAKTPFGTMGLSICYDLRFPYLYRKLAHLGAEIISVPSGFTKVTGQAHWHTLLRARAIETGCFIAAPAQAGTHANGRQTFGHSLMVDPWGEVLLDGGAADEGIYTIALDLAKVKKARAAIPALKHDREVKN